MSESKLGFDLEKFQNACLDGRMQWQKHADERRLERGIETVAVIRALRNFDLLENYSDSFPFPSVLLMGNQADRVIHIVAAFDPDRESIKIITVYFPDEEIFEPGFRTRRRK